MAVDFPFFFGFGMLTVDLRFIEEFHHRFYRFSIVVFDASQLVGVGKLNKEIGDIFGYLEIGLVQCFGELAFRQLAE